ncbi:MAG: protease HtpX [Chloroflexi bacterium]|nr:MAG: protease HtpX [Chloroflexota bacterium]
MLNLRTLLLLATLTGLFLYVGYLIGGQQGVTFALFFAAVMNFGSYWFSDRLVLAMTGAKPVSEAEAPELYAMVRRVSQESGVSMPRVYMVDMPQPNAFATGRDPEHGVVAVSPSIMQLLNRRELEGVIAHEMSHVKNRDTLVSAIAATLGGAISYLVQMSLWFGAGRRDDRNGGGIIALVGLILAPIAALLVQLAISRGRELGADATGAETIHDPLALASALEKLDQARKVLPAKADLNPSTAHLFIVNPFSGDLFASLFSTHPPTEERVRRLRQMAGLAD